MSLTCHFLLSLTLTLSRSFETFRLTIENYHWHIQLIAFCTSLCTGANKERDPRTGQQLPTTTKSRRFVCISTFFFFISFFLFCFFVSFCSWSCFSCFLPFLVYLCHISPLHLFFSLLPFFSSALLSSLFFSPLCPLSSLFSLLAPSQESHFCRNHYQQHCPTQVVGCGQGSSSTSSYWWRY